MDIEFCFFF